MTDIVDRLNDSLSAGYSELRKEAVAEITRLRAKIEAMEQQEPVKYEIRRKPRQDSAWSQWKQTYKGNIDRMPNLGVCSDALFDYEVRALYLAPGAQPAPSVPEGLSRVSLDFYWDSEKQHHIPVVRVEFEPVPAGSPNDAKGWQDRDRFAALITVAQEAKP